MAGFYCALITLLDKAYMLADLFVNFFFPFIKYNLIFLKQVSSSVSMDTISGPNSLTRQFHKVSGIPRSRHSARTISSTSVAATTAFPAEYTVDGFKVLACVLGVWSHTAFSYDHFYAGLLYEFLLKLFHTHTGSRSYGNHFKLVISKGRMIGPAWKMALFLTSTGSGLCSSTRRR